MIEMYELLSFILRIIMGENIFNIPGLPHRPRKVADLDKIYSDHVLQLIHIPDFASAILTWNVYNNSPLCGYPWQKILDSQHAQEFIDARHERVNLAIQRILIKHPEIGILSFQEMTAPLRKLIKNQLGDEWKNAYDEDRTTFYKTSDWKLKFPQTSNQRILKLILESSSDQRIIELSNFHGNWSPDALQENVEFIMGALKPDLNDECLKMIVGDMNSPLKPIRNHADMTALCPPDLNELWSEPCAQEIAVLRALYGAFACQGQQLKDCISLSIDVTTGEVFQAHQKKRVVLNYCPKEKMYLQDVINARFKN